MQNPKRFFVSAITGLLCLSILPSSVVWADDGSPKQSDTTTDMGAQLPAGMTLNDVLDRAEKPPPANYPDTIPDDRLRAFLQVEQFEYRYDLQGKPDQAGTEFTGWFGGDFNRLWLKGEGEATWQGDAGFDADFEGESETDLLYGRLFAPFWTAQIGAQYANEWTTDTYKDIWAGALAIQGLAPGKFELDASLYVTENLNMLADFEAEYDIRITQRLVFQPRTELSFSAQDVDERAIGVGMRSVVVDLRLRYEFLREFAPYLGARYQQLVFGTADRARAAGEGTGKFFLLGGVRFALY